MERVHSLGSRKIRIQGQVPPHAGRITWMLFNVSKPQFPHLSKRVNINTYRIASHLSSSVDGKLLRAGVALSYSLLYPQNLVEGLPVLGSEGTFDG